jgi:pepF/M3 family oligoendopeptidase
MNTEQKKAGENCLPHWQMETIYPELESGEYKKDILKFKEESRTLEQWVNREAGACGHEWIREYIDRYNRLADLYLRLFAFAYGFYSTDTNNQMALQRINELEALNLSLKRSAVVFRNKLSDIDQNILSQTDLQDYLLFIDEQVYLSGRQMSETEEDLAEDLSRSGADAWERLQEVVTASLKAVWDEKSGEEKTLSQLRGLAYHKDREVREKAYHKELDALEKMKVPLAYAINGVKGFTVTLNNKRKYENTLAKSLFQSRINREVLTAMIGAMEESLPMFRRYLLGKARSLGLSRLAFFDIFAPVGSAVRTWTFEEAKDFIVEQFYSFSDDLGDFTEQAFKGQWIDAEPREGKVGGAFCMDIPQVKESRILCNFDGSFSSVTTLAHELGHAYHHHVLKDCSFIHRDYPMTLAETASIFCEHLILHTAIRRSGGDEKLALLEVLLADATQVVVDILSRFYFESELLEKREKKELSADELNQMMLNAQGRTYGEALDKNRRHPYMWAVKSHYYTAGLAFYNFPYAFGLLFGLGLHSIYQQEGASFRDRYRKVLLSTGRAGAIDVTRELGFDIEKPLFWQRSLGIVAERVDEFTALAD